MSTTFTLTNVPIFAVGTWNHDEYSEADLDHMVAAYGAVGFKPPVKLGHDESQPLAKSDGMPALGWVANLRRVGKQLFADLRGLPAKVYEAIRRQNYNRVSAEVYWDYEEGGRKLPRVLKALALLGADIPAVTSLAALESLYDARGKPFRRYDMGLMDVPMLAPTDAVPQMGDGGNGHGDGGGEKKDRADVNYRLGGADDDQDGLPDRCGSCRFFEGEPDIQGTAFAVGGCSLVCGDIGSTMLCDLYEPMEAFSADYARAKKEAGPNFVRPHGSGFAVVHRGTGKVVGTHPTREAALAHMRSLASGGGKGGGKDAGGGGGRKHSEEAAVVSASETGQAADTSPGPRAFSLSVDAVRDLCPTCADKMAFLNLKELKLAYDPATKTYAGFSQGLCNHFGEASGFRTRCMADKGKLSESVGDLGAFCNALKEYCFGSVTAESGKQHEGSTPAKEHKSDASKGGRKHMMGMSIKEQNGQHCVTNDADDSTVKCFPTKAEAEAYMASENRETPSSTALSEKDAEIKTLKERLAAVGQEKEALAGQVATLSAKVPELEQYVSESEAEKARLKEEARKAANDRWVKSLSAEGNVRILPVEEPIVTHLINWMTAPNGDGLKTYKQADGKELPNVEAFKALFEQRAPLTALFTELSKGTATDAAGKAAAEKATSMTDARAQATTLAKQYMKDKGEKNFKAALAAVYAAHPELHELAAGVTEQGAAKVDAGAAHMGRFYKR